MYYPVKNELSTTHVKLTVAIFRVSKKRSLTTVSPTHNPDGTGWSSSTVSSTFSFSSATTLYSRRCRRALFWSVCKHQRLVQCPNSKQKLKPAVSFYADDEGFELPPRSLRRYWKPCMKGLKLNCFGESTGSPPHCGKRDGGLQGRDADAWLCT